MAQIVVVGNISARLVIEVAHLPVAGESVQGGRLRSFAGGKGGNQAVAAALTGHNIDVSGILTDDSIGTGVAVDATSNFSLITSPGANQTLSPEHVRRADPGFPSLVLGVVEVQSEAIVEAFKFAGEVGAATVLSAESAGDISPSCLPSSTTSSPTASRPECSPVR